MAPIETEPYLWIVIAGAVASFIMSFGIGVCARPRSLYARTYVRSPIAGLHRCE
jgi:hypothetical protein